MKTLPITMYVKSYKNMKVKFRQNTTGFVVRLFEIHIIPILYAFTYRWLLQ